MRVSLAALLLLGLGCRSNAPAVEPLGGPALPAGQASADPALAVGGGGEAYLAWVGGDSTSWSVFFSRSTDQGGGWSPPIRVAGGATEVKPHGESSPRLVAGPDGKLALIWASSVTVPGRQWPATAMRLARSTDGGLSWSPPRTLNDDSLATPVSHQFHGAAWGGDSTLLVAWLDEREVPAAPTAQHAAHLEHNAADVPEEPDAAIYLARSEDFGRSWLANRRLAGAACPCCRISMTRTGEGKVVGAWRQHFPGNVRDVVLAAVEDSSMVPTPIHADGWVYPGCPHAGPALASAGDLVHTVWYTGKPGAAGMFYGRSSASAGKTNPVIHPLVTGKTVATTHGAVAAFPGGGALVAWDLAGGGSGITLAAIDSAGRESWRLSPASGAGGHHPQIVALGDSGALVAWTVTSGGKSAMRLLRVPVR